MASIKWTFYSSTQIKNLSIQKTIAPIASLLLQSPDFPLMESPSSVRDGYLMAKAASTEAFKTFANNNTILWALLHHKESESQ